MPTEERKETDDVTGPAKAAGSGSVAPAPDAEAETPDQAAGALPRVLDEHGEALGEPGAEAEPDPDATADPPPAVAELAAACVRFVATRYGVHLDFAPETLSLVDQWVRDARGEMAARPQLVELVEGAAGAYLGEVVRRTFGARWITEGEHAGWRLVMSTVYCAFNPIGMAREALLLGEAEGWHAHFELDPGERDEIEARLAALPAVGEDEYYAPSTRFDVVHLVVDTLRDKMRATGLGDTRFTEDDYADV